MTGRQRLGLWGAVVLVGLAVGVGLVLHFTGALSPAVPGRSGPTSRPQPQFVAGKVFRGKSADEWIKLLDSSQVEERRGACESFSYLPLRHEQATVAAPQVIALLSDPRPEVRQAAAEALRQIGRHFAREPDVPLRKAIQPLAKLLADEHAAVRRAGAAALELLVGPGDGAAVPALCAALQKANREEANDGNAHGHCADVVRALGKIGPEAQAAVPSLTELIVVNKETPLRAEVMRALRAIGPPAKAAIPRLEAIVAGRPRPPARPEPPDRPPARWVTDWVVAASALAAIDVETVKGAAGDLARVVAEGQAVRNELERARKRAAPGQEPNTLVPPWALFSDADVYYEDACFALRRVDPAKARKLGAP